MKKLFFKSIFCFALLSTSIFIGCENQLEMILPQGPKGEQGPQGEAGLSAFELWKLVYGKDPNTPIEEFFEAIKGDKGDDGVTPTVEIGANGNWYINGTDTGVPATGPAGEDGQDGQTPTVEIGANGNWYINGTDTGVPATGQDGQDGKSAYELWKDAVDEGKMTNKDGTPYTGGNTWEEFLKWLQGGDVSVLHQYWITLPGNEGKTIEQFITELFDCHCDGISIGIVPYTGCVELETNGDPKAYYAKLVVTAESGTKVNIKSGSTTLFADQVIPSSGSKEFSIKQTSVAQNIDIICALAQTPTEQVTKNAIIPALKYISGVTTSVTDQSSSISRVVITFVDASKLDQLLVNNVLVEDGKDGWTKSSDGKVYYKDYTKLATAQTFAVNAKGANGECTALGFTVPQLTPVTISADPTVAIKDECELTVTVVGTEGMTVSGTIGSTPVAFVEGPSGTYKADIPRSYSAYTLSIKAEKSGYGTTTKTVNVSGTNLLSAPFNVTWADLQTVSPRVPANSTSATNYPFVEGTFVNNLNKEIIIVISRPVSGMTNERFPWIAGNTVAGVEFQSVTLAANATKVIIFHRDVTPTFATGSYVITMTSPSQCVEYKAATKTIANQRDFNYNIKKISGPVNPGYPGGGGSNPYDPNYPIPTQEEGYTIFEVTVTDAAPNSYVQFLLNTTEGYRSVWGGSKKTDASGSLTILVKMKDSDLAVANGGKGEFKFFDTASSSTPTYAKEFTFTAPQ